MLVLSIVAFVVYTYCGAARAAGRSERDEAVATRVRGLIDREKEAIFAILDQKRRNECGSPASQRRKPAAHMPRQLKVSRRRPHHACHMSGVVENARHMSAATNQNEPISRTVPLRWCAAEPHAVRSFLTTQHQAVERVLQTRY